MTARILSGKEIAEQIKREVAEDVKNLVENHGIRPCLAVVRVGEDAASAVYVGNKVKTSEELGLISEHKHLSAETSQEELLQTAAAMQALQLAITMTDKNLIHTKTEELNSVSRPYAERIMDNAISEAMQGKKI